MINFTCNVLPKSPNQFRRKHYFVLKKEKDFWLGKIKLELIASKSQPILSEKISIKIHRKGNRYLDYDNLVSSFKGVIDCLKILGYIVDDRWDFTGVWEVSQEKCKKNEECFTLFIIPS